MLRFALLLAIVAGGFAAVRWTPLAEHLTQEEVVALLGHLEDAWWSPLLLVGLYLVTSVLGLPVSPLMVAGGAVFGYFFGSVLNLGGLFLGAAASYYLAQALGRDFVEHLAGDRLRKVERAFERRGFWPLVQVRFLPIPFAAVNFGAALAGVSPARFFLASGCGLAPATLIHTIGTAALIDAAPGDRWSVGAVYLGAILLFAVLTGLPSIRLALRRRERYRELTDHRRRRREA